MTGASRGVATLANPLSSRAIVVIAAATVVVTLVASTVSKRVVAPAVLVIQTASIVSKRVVATTAIVALVSLPAPSICRFGSSSKGRCWLAGASASFRLGLWTDEHQ
jgi:hypothetical protein